jgi:hypothetical protein
MRLSSVHVVTFLLQYVLCERAVRGAVFMHFIKAFFSYGIAQSYIDLFTPHVCLTDTVTVCVSE